MGKNLFKGIIVLACFLLCTLAFCGCSVLGEIHIVHDFGEWETVIEPTCTEPGKQESKCSGWDNINYDEFWQEGGIGASIGALSGMLSFGFASIASSVGSKVGFAFSQTAHLGSGITFGSVFGTSALMTIGSGIGTVLGSISGAVVGDYIGSAAFGRPYTLTDK